MKRKIFYFLLLTSLFVFSCSNLKQKKVERPENDRKISSKTTLTRIEIQDTSDKPVLVIEPESKDVIKILGEGNKNIGMIEIKDVKLKLYDGNRKLLWSIKKKEDKYKIINVYEQEILSIKRKEGGFRVKDKNDNIIAKIKPKDYGFKISDESGKIFGKVKKEGDLIKIKDEAGNTLYKIKGNLNSEYASFLTLPGFSLLQKVSILVCFLVFE